MAEKIKKHQLNLTEIVNNKIRTYADELALLEKQKRIKGVTNNVFANNGTTPTNEKGKAKVKKVEVTDKDGQPIAYGSGRMKAGEVVTYKATIAPKKGKLTDEELAVEKTKISWIFWVGDKKVEATSAEEKKKTGKALRMYRLLAKSHLKDEASKDFLTNDAKLPIDAIEKCYLKYTIGSSEEGKKYKDTLTIAWSKWLDEVDAVRVEAYIGTPLKRSNSNDAACSRIVQAPPEILEGYWANDNKDNITKTTVGYKEDVYMCLKTLGMTGKTINMELWEDDYGFGDEKIDTPDTAFEITGRHTYKRLEIPDAVNENYEKQRGGLEFDELELYFKLPELQQVIGFNKKGYAHSLNLTTHEKISTAYFAKQAKRQKIDDSTLPEAEQIPHTHTIEPWQTIEDVAKQYDLNAEELAKRNGVSLTKTLTFGGAPIKLKSDAQIAAEAKAKEERAKKREKAAQEPYYQQIDSASLGSEVHLVVETANLHGKKVTIEVFDNEERFADDDDTAIKLLKDDTEVTKLDNITIDDTGKAVVKVKLRPKSDEDFKKLKEKFKDDKVAKLYLKVTCKGTDKTHKETFLEDDGLEVNKSKRAPWMEYAEQEYKTYKGINENTSPLKERIEEYFDTTNAKTGKHSTPWCGAFVNWCFEQTDEYKGTNTGLNALAFDWGSKGNSKAKASKHKPDGWANGEECEPFYGAVVVLNYSHTAFIVGKNSKKNKYVYLGGNQGGSGSGTQKIQYGSVTIGKEFMIMKPKDYDVSEGEKTLKEYNVNKDGSYETTR